MLLDEVDAIQNPGLGATLIWRAVCGYHTASDKTEGCPFLLAFIILPVLYNEDLREVVTKTWPSSGFRKFEGKFGKKEDLLYSIQDRAAAMRDLSRRSLAIGFSTGLISLSSESACLWPRSTTFTRTALPNVHDLAAAAEKLGLWAQKTSLRELCFSLRLEL